MLVERKGLQCHHQLRAAGRQTPDLLSEMQLEQQGIWEGTVRKCIHSVGPEFQLSLLGYHAVWRSGPHRIAEAERTSRNHLLPSLSLQDQCTSDTSDRCLSKLFSSAISQAELLVLDFISMPKIREKTGVFSVYTDMSKKLKMWWIFISECWRLITTVLSSKPVIAG